MKIIIEVWGGLVANVYANGSAEVEIFDLDVSDFPDPGEREAADQRAAELKTITENPDYKKIW